MPIFKGSANSSEANAAVEFKLKPVLIYHIENPRVFLRIMLNLLCWCSTSGTTKPG